MAKVAIFGSDRDGLNPGVVDRVRGLGRYLAGLGHELYTGACWGYPYEAAKAAREAGGRVVGISPASDPEEHEWRYGFPIEPATEMVYTGKGFAGRGLILADSVDAAFAIEGSLGTLHEVTLSLIFQKDVGILRGSGGIASYLEGFFRGSGMVETGHFQVQDTSICTVQHPKSRGESLVVYHEDPIVLADTVLDREMMQGIREGLASRDPREANLF